MQHLKSGLFILLLLLNLSSCSYLKNVQLLTGGELKRENFVQLVPFEWRKDLIVVKARINSDTSYHEFIFDTGAFNSKIESDLAGSLGLKKVTVKTNSTAQGMSKKIDVVRIDSISFGETTFYNIGAGKLKYEPSSASQCIASDGIIGANLIKLAHWKIDFQKQLLYFSDKPFELKGKKYTLPFSRPVLSGTPKINISIEDKNAENIMFDLGYNGGLILPLSLASHFENKETKIVLDKSTSGIYGTNADSILIKELMIGVGGHKSRIPVEFSNLNKALLGNEFLKHFIVVINNETNEISLQKQKEIEVAAPRNFLIGIQNDSLWVVTRTSPELPFELGETILSVNNNRPDELFSSHCDYVMNTHKLFEEDSLKLEKADGSIYILNNQ